MLQTIKGTSYYQGQRGSGGTKLSFFLANFSFSLEKALPGIY
jgi:hypothetical protein